MSKAFEYKGKTLIPIKEAAELIGRSLQTVYQNHKEGWKWTRYDRGQEVFFDKAEVQKWAEDRIKVTKPKKGKRGKGDREDNDPEV